MVLEEGLASGFKITLVINQNVYDSFLIRKTNIPLISIGYYDLYYNLI